MMQGFGGPAPQQEQMQEPAAPGGEAQGDPRNSPAFNKFVGMAMMAIFDEKFLPMAVKTLKQAGPLPEAIAKLGVTVAGRIYEAAKSQGEQIDPQIIMLGGFEILQKIAELAQKAGLPVQPDTVEDAFYIAADMFKAHLANLGDYSDEQGAEDARLFMEQFGEEPMRAGAERLQKARGAGAAMMPGAQFAQPGEQQQ